jgi:hypothetical protein
MESSLKQSSGTFPCTKPMPYVIAQTELRENEALSHAVSGPPFPSSSKLRDGDLFAESYRREPWRRLAVSNCKIWRARFSESGPSSQSAY